MIHFQTLNIERCLGHVPFTLSNPHFLQSPDHLWTDVDGLAEPTVKKYGTYLDIEAETGTVLNLSERYQVNVVLPLETLTKRTVKM